MGYSKLNADKIKRDPLSNFQVPRSTIFGTFDWYKSLNFPQQKAVALTSNFLDCWEQMKYPYYQSNTHTLDSQTYDWLFKLICRQKSEIQKWLNIDVSLDIQEKLEGHFEDSYTLFYECEGMRITLKFMQEQSKANY